MTRDVTAVDAAEYNQLRDISAGLQKESDNMPRKVGTTVLRVAQLDAERLTNETWNQLRQQYRKAFSYFNFTSGWELELDTIFSLLIFGHTIWSHNQTYGDRLHNVIYRSDRAARLLGKSGETLFSASVTPARWEKLLLLVVSILLPYVYNKLLKRSLDEGWGDLEQSSSKRRIHDYLYQLESAYRIMSFANLIIFLRKGEFRNLTDRLLGLRLVNYKSKVNMMSSFEFMDRQLVWKYGAELGSLIMPLFSYINIFAWIRKRLGSKGVRAATVVNTSTCPICMLNPIQVSAVTNCGHHFCYYCISLKVQQGDKKCPVCDHEVTELKRKVPK